MPSPYYKSLNYAYLPIPNWSSPYNCTLPSCNYGVQINQNPYKSIIR